jgi:hypothetical protein
VICDHCRRVGDAALRVLTRRPYFFIVSRNDVDVYAGLSVIIVCRRGLSCRATPNFSCNFAR